MAALRSRCGHYIFVLWFLVSIYFFYSSPILSRRRLDVYHTSTHGVALVRIQDAGLKRATCGSLKIQDAKKLPKIRHLHAIAQLCRAISSQLRHISTIGKKLLNSSISPTCLYNMVSFGRLAAENISLVWGTPANFNRFHVLWALLHGTLIVGVSQTLRRWSQGTSYIWQGGHHVGHWPAFQLFFCANVVSVTFSEFFLLLRCVNMTDGQTELW